MVEQRLRGERGSTPARVYARPLVLRPGIVLDDGGAAQGPERPALRGADGPGVRARPVRARPGRDLAPPATGRRRRERGARDQLRARQGRDHQGQGDPRRRLEAAPRGAGARAGADHVPVRRGAREASACQVPGAAGAPRAGGARDRGSSLLQPPRPRPDPPDRRDHPEPPDGEGDPARGQHHHPAALQELLPDPGAHLQAQGAGGAAGVRAGAARDQGGDPRAVPERDLPRPGGLLQHQRRGRGGADVLQEGRRQPVAARVGADRGDDPVSEPLQPVPAREARDRAAQRGDPRHAGRGLHRPPADGRVAARPAARRAGEHRHDRRALLRGPRAPPAGAALRGRGPDDPQPVDLHDARPAPAGPRPAGDGARPRQRPEADPQADDGASARAA